MTYLNGFNIETFLLCVICTIVLYLLILFVERFFWHFFTSRSPRFELFWTRFKIIAWALIFLNFLHIFWQFNFLMTSIAFLLLLIFGWSVWRNLFAGLWIKFSGTLSYGSKLFLQDIQGTVENVEWMNTSFLDREDELNYIPNGRLLKHLLTDIRKAQENHFSTLDVHTSKDLTIDQIKAALSLNPYVSQSHNIKIEAQGDTRYTISVPLIDPSFEDDLRAMLTDLGACRN